MSADRLRTAAAKLREAAEGATPGPWRHDPGKEWHTDPAMLRRAREGRITFSGEEFVGAGPLDATVGVAATGPADDRQSMRDAAYIATMSPPVALAMADWLDNIARAMIGTSYGDLPFEAQALAVADAVLAGQ